MKLRTALLGLFVVTAVAVVALRQQLPTPWKVDASSTSTPVTETFGQPPVPFSSDSSLKFEVMRERALTPYRLRPDRRLLLAVSEIRRLAGARDSAVTATFTAGRWTVRCGSQELGKVSELPDFDDMLDLLTETARKQAWARGWSDNAGPERSDLQRALDRVDASAALREADRAWAAGSRDAALFRAIAHAYALMTLQTPNWAGLADPLAARGLATLAYARALGAEDPKRESCLLAAATGYVANAKENAKHLSARDPVRLYAMGDGSTLDRLAQEAIAALRPAVATKPVSRTRAVAKKPTTPAPSAPVVLEAPYLRLLQLANRDDREGWSKLQGRLEGAGASSVLVLATGLRLEASDLSARAAERLLAAMAPRSTKTSRTRSTAAAELVLARRVQKAEAIVSATSSPANGVLFGTDLARSQRRALAYAALDRIAQHALAVKSPAEVTRWFATGSLKRVGRAPASFQRWYAHLASARAGKPDRAALRADVDSAAPGAAAALRSYEALRFQLAADDPALRESARDLAKRMDSRPAHRADLALIAGRDLGALSVAERLGTSAATALSTSDPSRLAYRALFQNDGDSLRAAAPPPELPDSVVGAGLQRKLVAHPMAWEFAEAYATWLEESGKYPAARRVLERWMTRTAGDSASLAMSVDARLQMARILQLEGRPQQALKLLGDLHRSGDFGVMERTALVLQDLGQTNQALAIAWAAHRASPQLAAGPALLAELFWRQGQYAEAANALRDARSRISASDWTHDIAPRYVACFRAKESEGVQAAEALTRAGFNDRSTFASIPAALAEEGVYGLAFELQSRVQLSGADGFESSILAYGYLKHAKGEAAALEWLRRRVPEGDRDLVGILAWQEQAPELLWSMAPSRLQGELGDYYWLLRAAACMAVGPSHPRYAETVNHVGRTRGTYHLEIARYLLGLREESEALTAAQTLRQRSKIYYFAGLKAERRGKLRDAADWYFMSVEADTGNNIESRWALRRLKSWAEGARSRIDAASRPAPPA